MKRQHARGVAAMYPGVCDRCEQTYARGDLIVPRGGGYIHVECASGGSDE